MFLNFIRGFYSKVFIGINLDADVCQVNIVRIKNNKIKQNIKTQTKLINQAISMETLKLVDFYQKKYPFTYIGFMSKSTKQGAIPTANPQEFLEYGINLKTIDFLSFQNTWTTYIDKEECQKLAHQIPEIGVADCLFSPFVPIFIHAQTQQKTILYAIQEKGSLSLAVCDHQCIYYGATHFIQDEAFHTNPYTNQETLSSLDHLLDALNQNIDDLDLTEGDQTEKPDLQEEQSKVDELNDFVRATFTAKILEETIQRYYQNAQSSFIDKIIIFDTYGITPDATKYINETLMIDTQIHPFSPSREITSLMFKEYKRGTL